MIPNNREREIEGERVEREKRREKGGGREGIVVAKASLIKV